MSASASRGGFALPSVLALVAVLSLVLLSAAAALSAGQATAREALERADFQRAAMSAEARALFLVATSPFAPDGLRVGAGPEAPMLTTGPSPLRLDGRAYVWPAEGRPDLAVSLQDEAGLVNVDASRPDAILRLLARLRLSATEAETLRDRLLDALDSDDRVRPRGLEASGYRAQGRTPPPVGGFADLAELAFIPGWEPLAAGDRRRELAGLATAVRGSRAFNVNTAPAAVLEIVLGVSPQTASRIVQAREERPIQTLAQLGLPGVEPGAPAVRPGGSVRLIVADRRAGLTYASRLAPGGGPAGPPWTAGAMILGREPAASDPSHGPVLADPTAAAPQR